MRDLNDQPAKRQWKLSRRTFLRGVGVTMALPWLESLPSFGETAAAAATPPKRFATLFWGNGVNANHWWAKGAGQEMELGKSLEPLSPVKAKLNFITGLFNHNAMGVGIHPGQTGNILSGAAPQTGMDSSQGSAMATPASRRKVRRETW